MYTIIYIYIYIYAYIHEYIYIYISYMCTRKDRVFVLLLPYNKWKSCKYCLHLYVYTLFVNLGVPVKPHFFLCPKNKNTVLIFLLYIWQCTVTHLERQRAWKEAFERPKTTSNSNTQLQHTATRCNIKLQHTTATHGNTLQHQTATHNCNTRLHTATSNCNTQLQHTATRCNIKLQHTTATHGNTRQRTSKDQGHSKRRFRHTLWKVGLRCAGLTRCWPTVWGSSWGLVTELVEHV